MLIAQTTDKESVYRYSIDLDKKNDKVHVELICPAVSGSSTTFHIAKIIPGTYSIDDYGRYIEQFRAYDQKGKQLPVSKPDINSWTIRRAEKLYRISYLVNDSYDDSLTKQVIFEPAGSNIQQDSNFIFNNHCFWDISMTEKISLTKYA